MDIYTQMPMDHIQTIITEAINNYVGLAIVYSRMHKTIMDNWIAKQYGLTCIKLLLGIMGSLEFLAVA